MIKIIKFKYDKDQDEKTHFRYNEFIKNNESIWGRRIPIIKQIISIRDIDFDIDVEEISRAYDEVFKIPIPNIKGFIVTTPFSMIDDNEEFDKDNSILYYSIYNLFGYPPSIVIGHELFHIYFEKYTERKIKNYDESKEYFTVVMNDIFGKEVSKGYPDHQEIRKKIFDFWQKTHSIDECIKIAEAA